MRILAGVWCLMSIVIVYSYTGKLTSYLTVPKLRPIPNSFEELAKNENYKLAVQANTVLAKSILVRCHTFFHDISCFMLRVSLKMPNQDAKSNSFRILGDFLRANPKYLFQTEEEIIKLVIEDDAAHPTVCIIMFHTREFVQFQLNIT